MNLILLRTRAVHAAFRQGLPAYELRDQESWGIIPPCRAVDRRRACEFIPWRAQGPLHSSP